MVVDVLANDTDPEGDPLTVVAVTAPAHGEAFLQEDGSIAYIPFPDYSGADSFDYTITDGNGHFDSATVAVTVLPVNDPPVVAHALADQSATLGSPFSFQVPSDAFSDADGEPLSYAATLADGASLPSWLSFDPATRTFSGTPGAGDAGSLSVRVTASDAAHASATDDFALFVLSGDGLHSATANGDVFLGNRYIEIGIDNSGVFGTTESQPAGFFGSPARSNIGFVSDVDGFAQGKDLRIDYFLPGSPFEAWAVGYGQDGSRVQNSNNGDGGKNIGFSVSNTSSGSQLSSVGQGNMGDLKITQQVSLGVDDKHMEVTITLQNTGLSNLDSVRYMRTFDPDNTVDAGGDYDTYNQILFQPSSGDSKAVVQATSLDPDPYSALAGGPAEIQYLSYDPRARVSVGEWITDVYDMGAYNNAPAKGYTLMGDDAIRVAFEQPSLAPGASTSFTFYVVMPDTSSDEAPVVGAPLADQTVNEDSPLSIVVPANAFIDYEGDALAYTATLASGAPLPAWLSFDPATRTFTGTPDDPEVGAITLRVRATDPQGLSAADDFVLTVLNVNDAPTNILLSNNSVAENLGGGTVAGTLSSVDPDQGDSHSYSLLDDAGGRFVLVGNELRVADGASFNYEQTSAYSINVRTTDAGGLSTTRPLTIFIGDVNEAPTAVQIDHPAVDENSPDGSVVGHLSALDPDFYGAHSFTLLDNAGGRFALSGNQLVVANGSLLDYEANASHTVRVRATDQGGLNVNQDLTIAVGNLSADLSVGQVSLTPVVTEVEAGTALDIAWTLVNHGEANYSGAWTDRVYLDDPNTPGLDRWVGDFPFSGDIARNTPIERDQSITVPAGITGQYRVVVQTDVYNQVPEGAAGETDNTTAGTELFSVVPLPAPNLKVDSVTSPASAFTGRQIGVEWTVSNTGDAPTSVPVWYDRIWLSADSVLDGGDTLLGQAINPSYLGIGQSYANAATVTLPAGIEGHYHLLVQVDGSGRVAEIGHEDDNTRAGATLDIQPIPLSELSDLAVTAVGAPAQALSGQRMSLTYTIDNAGQAAVASSGPQWVERIYMSTDAVLDNADRLLNTVWRSLPADQVPQPNGATHFTATESVTLPVGVSGDFYFFVQMAPVSPTTNAFTSNDTGFDNAATLVRLTPPPDLRVTDLSAPATALASHDLGISYRIANLGATVTPNQGWYDAFYLSTDTTLDNADLRLAETWHSGALNANGEYTGSVHYTLPDGLSGSYYLIAATDSRNEVFELDKANNVLAGATPIVIESRPADLVVTAASVPQALQAGGSFLARWTVANQGVGDTAVGHWRDAVVLSRDEALGNSDDRTLATFAHDGLLAPGGSYAAEGLVNLPAGLSGQYRLFVTTDALHEVYEASQEANNGRQAGSGSGAGGGSGGGETPPPVQVIELPPADLRVATVTAPATANSGQALAVQFHVDNTGVGRTNAEYWSDQVLLSTDAVLGNADDIVLGNVFHSGRLDPAQDYDVSANFTLPIDLQGDVRVYVRTDVYDAVEEGDTEGNNTTAAANPIAVALSATPDLVMRDLHAVGQAVSGQGLEVDWAIHNNGSVATGSGWRQAFYLSRDQILDRGSDIYLGYAQTSTGLGAGGDQAFSQEFQVPNGIAGRYYLFGVADSSDRIYERGAENNNTAQDAAPLMIDLPTPVDLVAGLITVPANGVPGQTASIQYTVTNQSGGTINGGWQDSLYLSTDPVWDIGDSLFARVDAHGPLSGGASYAKTATAALPGLVAGDYYVILRSDIRNQVPETDEANNLKASLDTTHLDVEALSLGVADTDSFGPGQAVYYRVEVGAGETLKFAFDRAAAEGRTELFVSYGEVPSRADFDYGFKLANSPDQSIVVPSTKAGTYYVMAYNAAGAAGGYSIKADTLHFAVDSLSLHAGSNRGQVTVRIDGAEFTPGTLAKLVDASGAERVANQVIWKDGTELWATFDLRGLATGAYDVKLEDGERVALLDDGFAVNEGPLGHLDYRIETPPALRPGGAGAVRVHFQNTGATDLKAPLLTLSGNALLKLPDDTDFSDGSYQLLGIANQGPAGVLAPGSEGSFQLIVKPNFSGAGVLDLDLSAASLDWGALLDSARPANVDPVAWEQVRTNLDRQVSSADGHGVLAQNATALAALEQRTGDVGTLFDMELNQATNGGVLPQTAEISVLGRGRLFQWDITATRQENGDVIVDLGGVEQRFAHRPDGSYQGPQGSVLTEAGGAFIFRQPDGTEIAFNLDGRFASILESDGHRMDAIYTDGLLTQIDDSVVGGFQFEYNDQGRLTAISGHAGPTASFAYDASGEFLTGLTTAAGTTQYTYLEGSGAARYQIQDITLADGSVRHFGYDSHGRVVQDRLGDSTITYRYAGINEIDVTDASGMSTHLWLNEKGQVAQVQDNLGHISELRYNEGGVLIGHVTADGTVHLFSEDTSGRPLNERVQEVLGSTAKIANTGDGQLSELLLSGPGAAEGGGAGSFMQQLAGWAEEDVAIATELTGAMPAIAMPDSAPASDLADANWLATGLPLAAADSAGGGNLVFTATDQNMWGTGSSLNLDITWDDLLFSRSFSQEFSKYGFSGKAELNANVGLVAELKATVGDVDLNYEIDVNAKTPDKVKAGETFSIDTSAWSAASGQIETAGPDVNNSHFSLDFLFNASGGLTNLQYDPPLFDPIKFDPLTIKPVNLDYNILDISAGNPSYSISGPYGGLSFQLPGQVNTSGGKVSGSNQIVSSGVSDPPIGNLNVDLDAFAHSL